VVIRYLQCAGLGAGGLLVLVLICLVRARLMRACGCCGSDEKAAQQKTAAPRSCGWPSCCASSSKVAPQAWALPREDEELSMRGQLPCHPQLKFPWESSEVNRTGAVAAAEAQADAIFALFDKVLPYCLSKGRMWSICPLIGKIDSEVGAAGFVWVAE
jgi:hypothetical protein